MAATEIFCMIVIVSVYSVHSVANLHHPWQQNEKRRRGDSPAPLERAV
jgi:hypothetical protein